MLTLANSMFVNADALISLRVLPSESHPVAQMLGPDKSKTGAGDSLSVYGLFHSLASTPQGKLKLRKLFLRPSLDIGVIEERHRTINLLLRPENSQVMEQVTAKLKRIRNIRRPLAQVRRGVYLPPGRASINKGVWATIQQFARYALELREIVRQIPDGEPFQIMAKVRKLVEFTMLLEATMLPRCSKI